MIKIDLITGFLGSGKTTFLKQYAKYLMAQGKNIGILENDFGAVNVDMLLLQELRGDQCELEMISGGCDKETHRRRFRTKLISMGMSGYDRILVEPSGIYDVDEFFDTLYDEPLNRWYEAGSVITILDAGLDEKLSEEEEYLLASEAANAGKIVLSKVQNVSEEKKEETIAHLNRTLEQAGSLILGVGIDDGFERGQDLFDGLQKFGLIRILGSGLVQNSLDISIHDNSLL